ncbi:MAG TPA: nucleotide exchange factor GrpE [Stenomitos sp.]
MADSSQLFHLSQEQRDRLLEELQMLLKERCSLQQALREQQKTATAANEQLFRELLGVCDALESLLNYITEHPEPNPQPWARLPSSLNSIQRMLLFILEQRQVHPIDFQETQPDFSLCQVVGREVRNDLEDQTITKIVRRGFHWDDKLLRPVEVITSQQKD